MILSCASCEEFPSKVTVCCVERNQKKVGRTKDVFLVRGKGEEISGGRWKRNTEGKKTTGTKRNDKRKETKSKEGKTPEGRNEKILMEKKKKKRRIKKKRKYISI